MRSQNINKEKDAINEAEYEEPLVTYEEQIFLNIFKCGKNILNRLEVTYEQACMSTLRYKYHQKILETLVDEDDCNNAPLSNEKFRKERSTVISEMEAEESKIILDTNNVTMDNFCQSPVTANTQGENANIILTSDRINNLDALAETLKGQTLDSTINDAG